MANISKRRRRLSLAIVALGCLLISAGAYLVVPPAGLIVAGVLAALYGLLLVPVDGEDG